MVCTSWVPPKTGGTVFRHGYTAVTVVGRSPVLLTAYTDRIVTVCVAAGFTAEVRRLPGGVASFIPPVGRGAPIPGVPRRDLPNGSILLPERP
jgi:hypothetical protein